MYRQILSDFGSYASVISLVLTGYIAWNLRQIKNTYIFRVRAREFVKALNEHRSTLIGYANEFDKSRQEIGNELIKLDVKLGSLQKGMTGQSKKSVKQLREAIRTYESRNGKEEFYMVYRGMLRVIEEVKEFREQLNLE